MASKLLRVERSIHIYKNEDNDFVEEINVDFIPLDTLKEIVPPPPDDPLLYDGYELDLSQLQKINAYLPEKIEPDCNVYLYVLICLGIYDWDGA